ncbi:hypothetical protein DMN91_003137 [Ooceraea biroi]|uniref:CCHC-type domain-containing protein n=1 Tax=Ooceraea biroi TaxID=2015173 RepID=A0A3L8DY57_OOCBI|nr:hypothetical protein DMN91_003137 [Ooceraea biroi]
MRGELSDLHRRRGSKSMSAEAVRLVVQSPAVEKKRTTTGVDKRSSPAKLPPDKSGMLGNDEVGGMQTLPSPEVVDERLQVYSRYGEQLEKQKSALLQLESDLRRLIDRPDTPLPQRVKPRIIANTRVNLLHQGKGVEILTPDDGGSDEGWVQVRRKRAKGSGDLPGKVEKPPLPPVPVSGAQNTPGSARRRPPRAAAVTLRAADGKASYGQILQRAKKAVNIKEISISNMRIRHALNGGIVMEVPGPDGAARADDLAGRLRGEFGAEILVQRPTTKGELRISGFDLSVTEQEMTEAIMEASGCLAQDVKLGVFRRLANGLYAVWVRCPLTAANKLVAVGRLPVGWTMAAVELLRARPLQCFRCWEFGHVITTCSSEKIRSGCYFRCGLAGHKANDCSAAPNCVLCADRGLSSNHRLGTANCGCVPRSTSTGIRTQ